MENILDSIEEEKIEVGKRDVFAKLAIWLAIGSFILGTINLLAYLIAGFRMVSWCWNELFNDCVFCQSFQSS